MKKIKIISLLLPLIISGCSFYETESKSESKSTPAAASSTSKVDNRKQIVKDLDAYGLDGKKYDQSLFKGKITLLNLWGTYCTPCKVEMPYLGYLHRKYADYGFQVVGIVVDVTTSTGSFRPGYKEKAEQICAESKVDYVSLLPAPALTSFINSTDYIPYSVFIDENGYQLGEEVTGSLTLKNWDELIDSVIMEYGF